MLYRTLLFFLLFLIYTVFIINGDSKKIPQIFGVVGRLTCDGKPMNDIKIKAFKDNDHLDTLLNKTYTNKNGVFVLLGKGESSRCLKAKVNIYHKCAKGWRLCYKKYTFWIPKKFIWKGKKIGKWLRVGQIRMSKTRGKWGERDCFN